MIEAQFDECVRLAEIVFFALVSECCAHQIHQQRPVDFDSSCCYLYILPILVRLSKLSELLLILYTKALTTPRHILHLHIDFHITRRLPIAQTHAIPIIQHPTIYITL